MYINGRIVQKTRPFIQGEAVRINVPRRQIERQCILLFKIQDIGRHSRWHRVIIVSNEQGQEINRIPYNTVSGPFKVPLILLPNELKAIKITTVLEPNEPQKGTLNRVPTIPIVDLIII